MDANNATEYRNCNHLLQKEIFLKVVSTLNIKPGFRCLDIGCGPGNFTKLLVGFVGKDGYVLGIDPDQDRINLAKETYTNIPNLEFTCVNAGDMSTDHPKFDVVSSTSAIHWMKNEEKWKTFHNVSKLLKPGGLFGFYCLLVRRQ